VAGVTASNHVFNISAYTINTSILAGHCKGSPVDLLDLVISMATMYSWLSHTSGWNLKLANMATPTPTFSIDSHQC